MKNLVLCFVFLCIVNVGYTQNYFFNEKIDWSNYEKGYSSENKRNLIENINDELLTYLKNNKIIESALENFHIVDFNLDGIPEILYSGDAGTDAKRTLIFEFDYSYYKKTFDKFGELTNIQSVINKMPPYAFTLKEEACCGGFAVIYESFCPVLEGSEIKFMPSVKYSSIVGMSMPESDSYFETPIPFKVKNELYYLRLNPVIDNETVDENLHITGNVISQYTVDSKGYAISEKQDQSGRTWWFVIMHNNIVPQKSIFSSGSNDENHYYSLGWMSNKFLEIDTSFITNTDF